MDIDKLSRIIERIGIDRKDRKAIKEAIVERENTLDERKGRVRALKRAGYLPSIEAVKRQIAEMQLRLDAYENGQANIDDSIERAEREVSRVEEEIEALSHYRPSNKVQRMIKRFLDAGFTQEELEIVIADWKEGQNGEEEEDI